MAWKQKTGAQEPQINPKYDIKRANQTKPSQRIVKDSLASKEDYGYYFNKKDGFQNLDTTKQYKTLYRYVSNLGKQLTYNLYLNLLILQPVKLFLTIFTITRCWMF
jgi:hypothetical protein